MSEIEHNMTKLNLASNVLFNITNHYYVTGSKLESSSTLYI